MPEPKYKRVLLKLSGEALCGDTGYGINPEILDGLAKEVAEVKNLGVEVAVVIGGGNIFRGVAGAAKGMDRTPADYMGMMATIINGLALQDAFERNGLHTRVMSALQVQQVAETYIGRRARRHLEKGRVVVFAAGTGNPYFTTDTAASLRAMEIGAEVLLKATKVDGVFDKDPVKHKDAKMFTQLNYLDVLKQELKVMDATATSLCMDNSMRMIVFNMTKTGNIKRVILGETIGTLVTGEKHA